MREVCAATCPITTSGAALAAARGASIVRVHDVRETAEALALVAAAARARLATEAA